MDFALGTRMPRARSVEALLAGLALVLSLGCERPAPAPGDGYVPPPAPKPLGLPPGAAIDRNKIIEVGRSQRYDENPGSSDESILDDGVRAVIEPEEGVWQLDSTSLKAGVVVGRFRNRSAVPLARLGLIPGGTTYWFIYQGEKGLTSAFIADTSVAGYDVTGLPTMIHKPSRPWRQSVAQWQLPDVLRKEMGLGALGTLGVDKESGPWIACVTFGCCKIIN